MEVDESIVAFIANTYYDLQPTVGSIKPLCGYSDKNFSFVDAKQNKTYALKVVNYEESNAELTEIIDEILEAIQEYCNETGQQQQLDFQVPRLVRTTANKSSCFTAIRLHTESTGDKQQEAVLVECNVKLFEYFDGLTLYDYINKYSATYKPAELYFRLGKICSQLFRFFRTQRHLEDKLKAARGHSFPWQMSTAPLTVEANLERVYPAGGPPSKEQHLVNRVLQEYYSCKDKLLRLPEFILHCDLSNKNLLIDLSDPTRLCVIDFQDLQLGPQVIDLAVTILYSVLKQEVIPIDEALQWVPHWICTGYQSNSTSCSMERNELELIPTLMKLRLVQSLLNGQLAYRENPKNTYVMHTNQQGWQLLELMLDDARFSDSNKLIDIWCNGPPGLAQK